jgi:hypothetical protein
MNPIRVANTTLAASGPGLLHALLISHAQTAVQTVTLYDATEAPNGQILAVIHVHPHQSPAWVPFSGPGSQSALAFRAGLVIAAGSCDVLAWVSER